MEDGIGVNTSCRARNVAYERQSEVSLPGDLSALPVDVGPHDAGLRQVRRNLLNLQN
jgi:hypothetical protein